MVEPFEGERGDVPNVVELSWEVELPDLGYL